VSGISGAFVQPFTAVSSIIVTHNFNAYPVVQVISNATPPLVIVPLDISHTSLMSLTVTFDGATSGSVICTIGGVATTVTTVAVATYNILPTENLLLVTTTCTLTLPAPTGLQGKEYNIKHMAANGTNVTVNTFGGIATIDGDSNKIMLAKYTNLDLFTDGTNWFIV
jgi:hypothetical protein